MYSALFSGDVFHFNYLLYFVGLFETDFKKNNLKNGKNNLVGDLENLILTQVLNERSKKYKIKLTFGILRCIDSRTTLFFLWLCQGHAVSK